MRQRIYWLLVAASGALLTWFLLVAPGMHPLSAEEGWSRDLDYLVKALKDVHPKPFFSVPESSFDAQVASLKAAIPKLSEAQRVVRLMQLVALLRDGHTSVAPLQPATGFHILPIQIYPFSDGYFVIHTRKAQSDFLGDRLVLVGDTPIETVAEGLATLIPRENDMTVLRALPTFLLVPEILHALGFTADPGRVDLTFEGPGGKRRRLTLEPISLKEFSGTAWAPATSEEGVPLYRRKPGEAFWLSDEEDRRLLFVKYNAVQSGTGSGETLSDFSGRIKEIVGKNPVERVVVDVRNNLGGDNTTYGPLLEVLREIPKTKPQCELFAIIGRSTFSAAVNFVTELQRQTHVTLAGEPTGGRPNAYGDPRKIQMPNSGIEVRISSRYWQKGGPDDTRRWIAPDLPVSISSADFFAPRDPVLEAILGGS
jgi:hypothetical protein